MCAQGPGLLPERISPLKKSSRVHDSLQLQELSENLSDFQRYDPVTDTICPDITTTAVGANQEPRPRTQSNSTHIERLRTIRQSMEIGNPAKGNNDKGFSRSTNISAMYGLVVVLFGFVIPMSEALLESWMTSHLVAVFMVYLYGVSSLFLLYALVHEYLLKKECARAQEAEEKRSRGSRSSSVVSEHYTYWGQTVNKADKKQEGFLNLGMDQDVEVDDDEDDKKAPVASTSSQDSDNKSVASSVDDVPRVCNHPIFVLPGSSDTDSVVSVRPNRGMRRNTSHYSLRRRFSTVPSMAAQNHDYAPDDVYNYIATHMATATMGHEGTNYFLKGGALIFAIANMVYVALRIEGDHLELSECGKPKIIYTHYVHLLFIVLQTSFLIKDVEFVLRKHKALVRFGLAHLVATNLCVWLRFLMLEVLESVHHSQGAGGHGETHAFWASIRAGGDEPSGNDTCDVEPIILIASPYLFPFILEYSLVAMSTAAFLFSSINIRVSRELYKAVVKALQRSPNTSISEEPEQRSGPISKTSSGLFLGVLTLAGCIISMILFFHWLNQDLTHRAELCYTASETALLVFMLIGVIMGMVKFFKFNVDLNQTNTLDHFLLLLSGSFYVVHSLFKFFSSIEAILEDEELDSVHIMSLTVLLVSMVQSSVQTIFLLDGMQRVYAKEIQRRQMQGRSIVTFLIVTNVTAWVFKSFQEKRASQAAELAFYGEVPWSIISSVAIPMILFYRFHSSICLAHMWHHCYKRPENHVMQKTILQ